MRECDSTSQQTRLEMLSRLLSVVAYASCRCWYLLPVIAAAVALGRRNSKSRQVILALEGSPGRSARRSGEAKNPRREDPFRRQSPVVGRSEAEIIWSAEVKGKN